MKLNADKLNSDITTFKNCIYNSQNVFDFMAGAYSVIAPYSPKEHQESLRRNGGYSEVEQYFELFCERSKVTGLTTAFIELKEYLLKWSATILPEDVYSACYEIIMLVDKKCVGKSFRDVAEPGGILSFECLNSEKTSDKFVVIPLISNSVMYEFNSCMVRGKKHGLRKRTAGKQPSNLQGRLKYHMLLPSEHLHRNLKFYAPFNSDAIYKSISKKNYELTIALFPLTSIAGSDILALDKTEHNDGKYFSVTGFHGDIEQDLTKRYIEAIEICKANQVDLAIFPEMLCSRAIVDAVSLHVSEGDPADFPFFMWLGSVWENNTNKCTVIDCYGEKIFEHSKQQPFEDSEGFTENLLSTDNTSHILDIEGVGRFMTGICKDITDIDLIAISTKLHTDFFVLPAFSPSLDIARVPDNLGKEWITVLCSNTCAARHPKNGKVSFISVPAKHMSKAETRMYEIPDEFNCKKCDTYCPGFIVKVKFMELEEYMLGAFAPAIETLHNISINEFE
ncbi:MAG: hypothetical protein FWD05_09230 [Oscillospiraceae bacterium]|nr:hypothetical protein [Oscillospiraceae bacterium]